MKNLAIVLLSGLISIGAFAQKPSTHLKGRNVGEFSEMRYQFDGGWSAEKKKKRLALESFMMWHYVSTYNDTVKMLGTKNYSLEDTGGILRFSAEDFEFEFEGGYFEKEVIREDYKNGGKAYIGVFKFRKGSDYDEVRIYSKDIVRFDRPNFISALGISFKKDGKVVDFNLYREAENKSN